MKDADRKKYRTEIPNIVDDSDLSVYAFRLYVHIKRVAGESGQCFEGSQSLAKNCKMSVGKVSAAKQELVDAGLIKLVPGDWKKGKADTMTVIDIWDRNFKTFSPHEKVDPKRPQTPSSDEKTFSPHESTFSPHEPKKEPIKKEHIEEESSSPDGEAPKPPKDAKLPTEHQKMFEAICHCVGWDYHIIDKSQKGQVAQTLGILSKAGYTISDLRAFYAHWKHQDWRGQKGQLPTLKELRAEIGKVKLRSSPILEGSINGNTLSTFNGSEK